MKNLIELFILILVMVSCEKTSIIKSSDPIYDIIYDTIKPLDYFPIYPGSWWKYDINDSLISIDSVSKIYKINSYRTSPDYFIYDEEGNIIQEFSDTVYVPFYNSQPIYGYEKIEWIMPPFGDYYIKWPILSETVGFEFERDWTDKRYGDFGEKVKVTDKLFNGQDSILILVGHWINGDNRSNIRYQEFIKGIGLSKELVIDTTNNDTVYKKLLMDWYINK